MKDLREVSFWQNYNHAFILILALKYIKNKLEAGGSNRIQWNYAN